MRTIEIHHTHARNMQLQYSLKKDTGLLIYIHDPLLDLEGCRFKSSRLGHECIQDSAPQFDKVFAGLL